MTKYAYTTGSKARPYNKDKCFVIIPGDYDPDNVIDDLIDDLTDNLIVDNDEELEAGLDQFCKQDTDILDDSTYVDNAVTEIMDWLVDNDYLEDWN